MSHIPKPQKEAPTWVDDFTAGTRLVGYVFSFVPETLSFFVTNLDKKKDLKFEGILNTHRIP